VKAYVWYGRGGCAQAGANGAGAAAAVAGGGAAAAATAAGGDWAARFFQAVEGASRQAEVTGVAAAAAVVVAAPGAISFRGGNATCAGSPNTVLLSVLASGCK